MSRWTKRLEDDDPIYTYIDEGVVVVMWSNDIEYMVVLPVKYD